MKFIGEQSWKQNTEEISRGLSGKYSSTDKTKREKLILCDCLDASLPVEECVGCTRNEVSVELHQFCVRATAAQ